MVPVPTASAREPGATSISVGKAATRRRVTNGLAATWTPAAEGAALADVGRKQAEVPPTAEQPEDGCDLDRRKDRRRMVKAAPS